MRVRLLSCLLLVALFGAPPLAVVGQEPQAVSAASGYPVGPSDTLLIKVFDEPSLSGTFRVDADGSITFPLVGRIEVGRKTVRVIEQQITKLLADGYLRRPLVSVEITEYRSRSIFIMGEVRAPGKYAIEGEVTLLEVLAKAGSFTPTAGNDILVRRMKDAAAAPGQPAMPGSDDTVDVMRVKVDELTTGKAAFNLVLQDGDTIIVEQAARFYISGFVRNPGFYVLQPNMTVQQAIAVAGGLTERGSDRGIKIQRSAGDKQVEVEAKPGDAVRPNDTIRIRQRFL